jgi:hypothetical protein
MEYGSIGKGNMQHFILFGFFAVFTAVLCLPQKTDVGSVGKLNSRDFVLICAIGSDMLRMYKICIANYTNITSF